jgi:hypothetical protein
VIGMICALATMISLLLPDPPRPRPAAMVLELRGRVEVRPVTGDARPVKVGELLYAGERLALAGDGSATVAILGVGTQERLAAGSLAIVGPGGCTPGSAVLERREQRPAVARTMKGVRATSGDGRKAVTNLRAGAGDDPPAITPIESATVPSDRPGFAWPPKEGAKGYRIKLRSGAGRELWSAEATEPKLDYPAGKEPLKQGYVFRWEVTELDFRPVVTGQFIRATEPELKQLQELKPLGASDDRADLLAAAMSYRRLGCYAEAIAAYERLANLAPGETLYREELADLYRLAGRPGDAEKAARGAKGQ